MLEGEKRVPSEILLREFVDYMPADEGFLEVRVRYITKQEYLAQNRRRIEAGSLRVDLVEGAEFKYKVHSSRGEDSYLVDLKTEYCPCPDYEYRARPNRMRCKHIIAANNHFRLFNSNGYEGHDEDEHPAT